MKYTTTAMALLLCITCIAQSHSKAEMLALKEKHGPTEIDHSALDAYIKEAMKAFDQPGLAVGIVEKGELVWSNGYGKLDLDKKDPVTPNSIFFMASISKAFTACAVGLLVDDGKLDWNDPVQKHMAWFSTPDPYRTEHFMVKDLLCHRSGWITFDGDLLWYGTDLSQREILERHSKQEFSYEFRDQFGYSNLMFIAAAQLIEEVSGKTWDEFVTERIITPLGMTRTTVETAALEGKKDVALPHVRKGQDPSAKAKSMPYQALRGADGATGINSCINDMAKWDAMWADEGKVNGEPFISPATFRTITKPHLAMGGGRDAALGWFVKQQNGEKVITHSGGMPGFILNHAVVPDKDLAVIALGNGESWSVFAITNEILDLYLGDGSADPVADMMPRVEKSHEREAARKQARIDARVMDTKPSYESSAPYSGTYDDEIYGSATIMDMYGVMHLTLEPAKNLFSGQLEHWHYDTYKWNHNDPFLEPGYVTFYFDANHNVEGFKIDQHSPDFHFYKLDFKKQKSPR